MIRKDNLELREKIAKLAKQQWHKNYIHGQMGSDNFDCAGLVWYVYYLVFDINLFEDGIGMSTTTKIMTSKYGKLTLFNKVNLNKDLSLIKKGDILLFHRQSLNDNEPKYNNKYPGHCGIYLGEKKFIHATRSKGKVIINNFDKSKYWLDILIGSKDVISDIAKVKKYNKGDLL